MRHSVGQRGYRSNWDAQMERFAGVGARVRELDAQRALKEAPSSIAVTARPFPVSRAKSPFPATAGSLTADDARAITERLRQQMGRTPSIGEVLAEFARR